MQGVRRSPIADRRLRRQLLIRSAHHRPADVVQWLGAVQAQEFEAAKWALALRMREGVADADVERAFEQARILRTHVMRPTWHFVTPADIRWLLELTAHRVRQAISSYTQRMELGADTLVPAIDLIARALEGHEYLTRAEVGERLQRGRMPMAGQRLALLTMHAELEGIICSGPRRGKRFTYALLAERAPNARRLPRDEALATLGARFFTSHGPATIRDFVWWSGLTTAEARNAVDMIKPRRETIEDRVYLTMGATPRCGSFRPLVHLLPIYDEYLIAYRDREAVPHGLPTVDSSRGSVIFQHAMVIAGQVAGTWRTTRRPDATVVDAIPLRKLTAHERRALTNAIGGYERFLGARVDFSIK